MGVMPVAPRGCSWILPAGERSWWTWAVLPKVMMAQWISALPSSSSEKASSMSARAVLRASILPSMLMLPLVSASTRTGRGRAVLAVKDLSLLMVGVEAPVRDEGVRRAVRLSADTQAAFRWLARRAVRRLSAWLR